MFSRYILTGSYFWIPAGGSDVVAVAGLAHDPVGEWGDDRHKGKLWKGADNPEEVAQAQSREAQERPQEEAKVRFQEFDIDQDFIFSVIFVFEDFISMKQ